MKCDKQLAKLLGIAGENKYNNTKVKIDGIEFDSIKEADRYSKLKILQRSGAISDLKMQVRYNLIPVLRAEPTEVYKRGPKKGQYKPGKVLENAVYYIADFVYKENGKEVVEDAKGARTKEYILKRKLMLWVHGIRIREV